MELLTRFSSQGLYKLFTVFLLGTENAVGGITDMISQKKTRTPGSPPSLTVNDGTEDKVVKDKSYTHILGANIQSNMSWQAHIEMQRRDG